MISNETDIAIIGAGIGGCIAALALAPHYSVTLIDKNAHPPPRVGESLPPAAKRIFSQLGLLELLGLVDTSQSACISGDGSFYGQRHLVSHGMASYWGSEHVQMFDNLRNPDGMGWHVDRQALEQTLRETAKARGVNCIWPVELIFSKPLPSEQNNEHWQLTLSSRQVNQAPDITLKTKIVIDATGRHCAFARQQGSRRQQKDKLISVWMTFCTPSRTQMGSIHPTSDGWWYCAPIPRLPHSSQTELAENDNGIPRVLSFQTDSDMLDKSLTQSVEALLNQANCVPSLATEFAKIDMDSINLATANNHGLVAANSSKLVNSDNKNWFAIGDAAMSFDPLSSQGMFNAMASAMQLCDLILDTGIDSEQGKSAIAAAYQQQLEQIWQHYEGHKGFYYAQEKRWSNQPFWQRRLA